MQIQIQIQITNTKICVCKAARAHTYLICSLPHFPEHSLYPIFTPFPVTPLTFFGQFFTQFKVKSTVIFIARPSPPRSNKIQARK